MAFGQLDATTILRGYRNDKADYWGCGGVAAWRAGTKPTNPETAKFEELKYYPWEILKLTGVKTYPTLEQAMNAIKALGEEGGLIIAVWGVDPKIPGSNYASLLGTSSSCYWEDMDEPGGHILHHPNPQYPIQDPNWSANLFIVVPGKHTRDNSPIIPVPPVTVQNRISQP
jgi:hypothetical protein